MLLKQITHHEPDIRSYMPGKHISNTCLVGVEIELEGYRQVPKDLVYWRAEADGSLRNNGIEFVLRQPLTGLDLEKAIDELYKKVLVGEFKANHRCSTHVHIDVRDLSLAHLKKIVFLYSMFERFIYDVVDPIREHNFYCTPMFNSLNNRRMISRAVDNGDFDSCPRYSGINLKSIAKYGSLEFRMHEGMTGSKDIKRWINMLMTLRIGAARFEDVSEEDILLMYSENTAEGILRDVFGQDILDSFEYKGTSRLDQSMRSAQDLLLLKKSGSLRQKEMEWARGKQQNIGNFDIPPDVLEILRERREEILNN